MFPLQFSLKKQTETSIQLNGCFAEDVKKKGAPIDAHVHHGCCFIKPFFFDAKTPKFKNLKITLSSSALAAMTITYGHS